MAAIPAAASAGSRPSAAAGGGATAPALNRRSTRPTLQPSLRPLTFKTVAPFLAAIRRSLVSLPAKVRTKALGNLADAVAIEWPIAVSIAVPIDQEIVACPARQDVDVNMQDRLPGEFAVGLN